MNARRISILLLFLSMMACDLEGCLTGQTITLVYREATTIDVQGQVIKDGESIGRVEDAESTEEGQRLLLRITLFEAIHSEDAFRPYQDLDGVMGLEVLPRGGDALRSGDTLYYPPRATSEVEPPPLALSSVRQERRPRGGASTDQLYVEPIELAPEEIIAFTEDTYERRSIRRTLATVQRSSSLSPAVQTRVENLIAETRRRTDERLVLQHTQEELPNLRQAFAAAAREALDQGDRKAAEEAVENMRQLALLEEQLQRRAR